MVVVDLKDCCGAGIRSGYFPRACALLVLRSHCFPFYSLSMSDRESFFFQGELYGTLRLVFSVIWYLMLQYISL